MKTPLCNIVVAVIATLVAISLFTKDVASQAPPVIKVLEVDGYNNVIGPYDHIDEKRSQIIIEKLENIRLECRANYPVQWIYTGNGIPIINTDISVGSKLSTTEQRRNAGLDSEYIASIYLGPLKEQHTGKYQCSRTDYVTMLPNLHLYVPGQDLFTSTQGKTIEINPSISSISIPCSVSDPRIKVSLFKLVGGVLKLPVTKAADAIVYDPKKGFRVNLRKVEDPEGRYLCTAHYNNDVRDVEYTITSGIQSDAPEISEYHSSNRNIQSHALYSARRNIQSDAPANYEEFKQSAEETCKGESCTHQCKTHTDCPSNMNCYTDFQCRDPCTYSIRCGNAAMCRITNNRPQCYCPSGFVGDPAKECLNIARERYENERYP